MFVFANGFNDKGAQGIVKKLSGKNLLLAIFGEGRG